ncbi:MAG: FG-GAP-like repeat-containing protein [Bacteroidales bacterium]
MHARSIFASAVLLATVVVLGTVTTGQSPPPRQLLVTTDTSGHLVVWRAAASGYEKAWEARPRLADANVKPAGNAFPSTSPGIAVTDCDGDGMNDLVALDSFGLTIYGAKPVYHAFEQATESSSPALAVGDVDGDVAPEIVTQRMSDTGGAAAARQITVFKVTATGVKTVVQQKVAGYGGSVAVGDVDNDKQSEILSGGSDGITILKRRNGETWEPIGTVPVMGGAGAIVVGDVDKDNKNEIVCANAGVGGKVAVYKHRKSGDRGTWPVMWQSRSLMTEGLTSGKTRAYSIVPDVAAADVDGDGQKEILAASLEYGKLGDQELTSSGRMHVFKFDGQNDFNVEWVSDRARGVWAAGVLAAGDLDGDGASEIAYYGRTIFKRATGGAKGFTATATQCSDCTVVGIGDLGELREPSPATRVVPVAWTVPGSYWPGQIVEGQTVDVALALRSVWAEAKNVTVKLSTADAGLEISAPAATTATIAAGGTVTLNGLQMKGRKSGTYAQVNLDISTGDGYHQVLPARVMVTAALPTYKPATESAVAEALEKARDDNQRVLIVWGSNADKTSQAFLESTVKNAELSRELSYEYRVVRADIAGSQKVAAKYGAVFKHGALPHLTLVASDGKVLFNEPVATTKPAQPVLAGATAPPPFDVKKVVETLKKYDAPPQDAKKMLAAALDRAKTESKTVFIWFSAPW